MKTEIPFTAEPSADARRRYEREALLFEQRAEDALCLFAGTMSKLRQASSVTPEGRRARHLWHFHANQYLHTINPIAAEYPEEDADTMQDGARHHDNISFCDVNGSDVTETASIEANTAAEDFRELLKDRKTCAAFLLFFILGNAIGWKLVQILLP